jgi:hypothetical protein
LSHSVSPVVPWLETLMVQDSLSTESRHGYLVGLLLGLDRVCPQSSCAVSLVPNVKLSRGGRTFER